MKHGEASAFTNDRKKKRESVTTGSGPTRPWGSGVRGSGVKGEANSRRVGLIRQRLIKNGSKSVSNVQLEKTLNLEELDSICTEIKYLRFFCTETKYSICFVTL